MDILSIVFAGVVAIAAAYGMYAKFHERRRRKIGGPAGSGAVVPPGKRSLTVVNFSHMLSEEVYRSIAEKSGEHIGQVVNVGLLDLDESKFFGRQMQRIIKNVDIPLEEWVQDRVLVLLPGYSPAAAVLLAYLHGIMGHFPTVVRIRPVKNTSPQQYEVGEIINLQQIRLAARNKG